MGEYGIQVQLDERADEFVSIWIRGNLSEQRLSLDRHAAIELADLLAEIIIANLPVRIDDLAQQVERDRQYHRGRGGRPIGVSRPRASGLKERAQQLVAEGTISRSEYEHTMGQPLEPGEAPPVRGESPLVAYRKAERELDQMLQAQRKRIDAQEIRMAGANETPAPNELDEDATAWFQRVMGLE